MEIERGRVQPVQLARKTMKSILLGKYNAAISCLLVFFEAASSTPNFYRPGHGVLLDWWLTNHTENYYNNSYLEELTSENKDFKKCPLFAANADSFEHTFTDQGRLQYGRYRAHFIAPQTGNHKLFAIFNSKCEVYISMPPNIHYRVIASNSATEDDWKKRVWTVSLGLVKGFRYFIEALHYAYGGKKGFFRLGVRLPDQTEVKPISKNFLWRSMTFYKWQGVLAEKINSIKFPSWELYSVSRIYDMNANNTSSYHCKSGLNDKSPNQFFGNNYALKYSGYIKPTYTRKYTFTMHCDELCEFELTNPHDGNKNIKFVIRNYTNPGSVKMQSYLKDMEFYPFTALLAESINGGYMRVINDGNYDPLLLNLKTDETSLTIPSPVTKVINQTYIKVTLKSPPSLPPRENWTHIPKYELFYRRDKFGNYIKFALNGSLPISVDITGLRNYTKYLFHARYYGYANNSTTLNIISSLRSATTAEDVPGKPPTSISGTTASSTSIKITWGAVPSDFQYGIITQYNVYFKPSSKETWEKQVTTASKTYHTITDLQYWTYYDVKISASTTPGEGSVSSAVKVRTAEHFPTAAPPSFGAYDVTDATIILKWNEIPTEYRPGIITGYSIMFKKEGTHIWKKTRIPKGKTTWTVDTLVQSTKYELKIAGETAVGTGRYSNVIVVKTGAKRLIEEKPTTYFTSLDFTDKVLIKHISKTTQVTTIEQCFRTCLNCIKSSSGCSCSSFNIKRPSSPSTSFTCEINASDHDACPLDFVKETGYQYYQIL